MFPNRNAAAYFSVYSPPICFPIPYSLALYRKRYGPYFHICCTNIVATDLRRRPTNSIFLFQRTIEWFRSNFIILQIRNLTYQCRNS